MDKLTLIEKYKETSDVTLINADGTISEIILLPELFSLASGGVITQLYSYAFTMSSVCICFAKNIPFLT